MIIITVLSFINSTLPDNPMAPFIATLKLSRIKKDFLKKHKFAQG